MWMYQDWRPLCCWCFVRSSSRTWRTRSRRRCSLPTARESTTLAQAVCCWRRRITSLCLTSSRKGAWDWWCHWCVCWCMCFLVDVSCVSWCVLPVSGWCVMCFLVCCQYLVDVSCVSWCVASIWLMLHVFLGVLPVSGWCVRCFLECVASIWLMRQVFLGVCCQYLVDVSGVSWCVLPVSGWCVGCFLVCVASIWLMLHVFLGVCCQYLVDESGVSWCVLPASRWCVGCFLVCVASIWLMRQVFLGVCCQHLVDVSCTSCGLLPGHLRLWRSPNWREPSGQLTCPTLLSTASTVGSLLYTQDVWWRNSALCCRCFMKTAALFALHEMIVFSGSPCNCW